MKELTNRSMGCRIIVKNSQFLPVAFNAFLEATANETGANAKNGCDLLQCFQLASTHDRSGLAIKILEKDN